MANKKKILIVEDDTYIRELYEDIFREEGVVVESAADGEEGLAKIKAGKYNLILLDIVLPKMDGLDILRQIKKAKLKVAPIVVLTNLGHDPVLRESLSLGAEAYLVKSDLTPDQLVAEVMPLMS